MIHDRLELINEEFFADRIKPEALDRLLADGWRHFGPHFFRYNFGVFDGQIRHVLPLRIRLGDLALSKSQRRTLRRNSDLRVSMGPLTITPEIEELFQIHKQRFKAGVPSSIFDFVGTNPSRPVTNTMLLTVHDRNRLVAASFFDVGGESVSSIYGIFNPEERTRSLGIFTMLKEIEFAREKKKPLYYHGYAYEGESFYDYKKRFNAIEVFDWKGRWLPRVFSKDDRLSNASEASNAVLRLPRVRD